MAETPLREPPALSAEVAAKAAEEGLGRRRAAYGTRSWSAEAGLAPKVVLVLGLVPLVLSFAADEAFLLLLALGLPVAGVGAFLLLRNRFMDLRAAGRGLHVFEHGLIVSVGGLPKSAFRWDSATVYQETVARRERGRDVVARIYRLERPDGPGCMIGWEFLQPEQWGPHIQRSVVAARLPEALRRIDAGGTVEFGAIKVNRDGVRDGGGSASWEEASLRIEDGWLAVKANGRKDISYRMVGGIPNFFVFHALFERLSGGR